MPLLAQPHSCPYLNPAFSKPLTLTPTTTGKSALHWAAAVDNVEALRDLLTSGGNPDAQDLHDETPLYQACREGNYACTRLLLERGASLSIVAGEMDLTARDIADQRGHFDVVELLDAQIAEEATTTRATTTHPTQANARLSTHATTLAATGFASGRGSLKKPRRRLKQHPPQHPPPHRVGVVTAGYKSVRLPDKPRPSINATTLAKSRYTGDEMPPSYDSLCATQLLSQHQLRKPPHPEHTQPHQLLQHQRQAPPPHQQPQPYQLHHQQTLHQHPPHQHLQHQHLQHQHPQYLPGTQLYDPTHVDAYQMTSGLHPAYSYLLADGSAMIGQSTVPTSNIDQQPAAVFSRYPTPPSDPAQLHNNAHQHPPQPGPSQPQTTPSSCQHSGVPASTRHDQHLLTPSPETASESPSPNDYNGQWSSDTGVNSPPLLQQQQQQLQQLQQLQQQQHQQQHQQHSTLYAPEEWATSAHSLGGVHGEMGRAPQESAYF